MRYLFVDRILEMVPGKRAKAIKNITVTEDVFTDHFPRFPVYPGALLIETMAQTGGLLIEKTIKEKENRQVIPMLAMVNKAKFKGAVLPGDSLRVIVEIENITEDACGLEAYIECDGKVMAKASLFFTIVDVKKHLKVENIDEINNLTETLERLSEFRRETNTGLF